MLIHNSKNQYGFTLIELVIIIATLSILAAVAAPKYLNISTQARINVLSQVQTTIKAANDLLFVKSKLPSYVYQQTNERFTDIDMDQNGEIDIDQKDPNKPDVRLIWSYLDNADLIKRSNVSADLIEERDDPAHTYIGYDLDGDGKIKEDNCSFKYTQVLSKDGKPVYQLLTSGC